MASEENSAQEEMKIWLTSVLKNENLEDFTFERLGNTEKGDGYMGDIVFVTVNGTKRDRTNKIYNMVLKCSKKSKTFRDMMPIKESFMSEINLYHNIIPCLTQFQIENGIKKPYDSVPKYFGSFVGENMEVIALENLRMLGYELYPKKKPMTRKHINLVTSEYAKFHASALALIKKHPQKIEELKKKIPDMREQFLKMGKDMFLKPIEESCKILKDVLDEESLSKWSSLKRQIIDIMVATNKNNPLKVFVHGDCWNNNFMFLNANKNIEDPVKVAFLDWQGARLDSPILDLSYFLFACCSKEDIASISDILMAYYKTFINQLSQLGIEKPEDIYPLNQFFDDWKQFSKFGILLSCMIMKVVSYERDEVVGIDEMLESGKKIGDGFAQEIRDTENYKNRLLPIAEYAVKNNLL